MLGFLRRLFTPADQWAATSRRWTERDRLYGALNQCDGYPMGDFPAVPRVEAPLADNAAPGFDAGGGVKRAGRGGHSTRSHSLSDNR